MENILIIVSVCMHALLQRNIALDFIMETGCLSMFMHAWVVWTSFAGYLEWMP